MPSDCLLPHWASSVRPAFADFRDRALIAAMVNSFARGGAVLVMKVEDYYPQGKRRWLRLYERAANVIKSPVTTR